MGKRKQGKASSDDEGEESGSDVSIIDVDFEFFDPNPKVDYLALKRLITQLFQGDAEALVPHALADLILSQPLLGTTVKTDGIESDPVAYLSVLNMHVHQNHESIAALRSYVLAKSSPSPALHSALQTLLGPEGLQSQNHVAFVFSERLVNMPVQVAPHMYRMLADEIRMANEENEPYTFTHYLFITRIYHLTREEAAELEAASSHRPTKKYKNKPVKQATPTSSAGGTSTYSFHPEDECIQKYALYTLDFALTSQSSEPRGEDALGVSVGGRLLLVPAASFQPLVKEMIETYTTM